MEHGSCFNILYVGITRPPNVEMGLAGAHRRHNAHRLYPKNMTEFVKQPPDTPKEKCDGEFKIKIVSPAQATVEQAKSEAKQLRETTQGKAPQSSTKRPRGQTQEEEKKIQPYSVSEWSLLIQK